MRQNIILDAISARPLLIIMNTLNNLFKKDIEQEDLYVAKEEIVKFSLSAIFNILEVMCVAPFSEK